MVCENCITENEFDPSIHKIENGPFDTQAECEDSKNSPVAFFSIDVDNPSILSEGQDLVITDLVIKLTDQNLIDSAIRQIAGLEPKKYLRGNIVDAFVWYNPEYDYHVDPNSIYFVDDIEALGNNQQYLDSYKIQAGRQLPGNVTVQNQVAANQPASEDCDGCPNTVFIPYYIYGSYCRCVDGIAPKPCPKSDCGVYVNTQQSDGSTRRVWNAHTVCVSSPHPDYVWNENLCEWTCPGDNSNKTVAQVKAECENQTTLGKHHTFKEETCECIPPTTCAPCPTNLKRRPNKANGDSGYLATPGSPCTLCECRKINNFGEPLCGSGGVIDSADDCSCICSEEKACPEAEKILVNPNLKWTPSIAGADNPCSCKCENTCSLPFEQNDDTCDCQCISIAGGDVFKCTTNGQILCVQCSSDNQSLIYNPSTCTCECGPITCPSMKVVTRISDGTSLGVVRNPICDCRCPEDDIKCLCGYSDNGYPNGNSNVLTECSGDKEYELINGQCECVCKNPKTNAECGPGKVWNEQDCKCECAPNHAPCLYGQEFNQDTCECECPSVIFNEGFVSGTLDSESLQCLYEVTCYRCEECPTGRTRNLAREIIQGKSCSDFVYSGDKHYVSDCNDCETLDIVTDAVLTDPNTITATISKITSTGGAESFDEIEIELVKSNPNECCSEAVLNKTVKRTRYGYSLKSVSTTQIPTNPGTCAQQ